MTAGRKNKEKKPMFASAMKRKTKAPTKDYSTKLTKKVSKVGREGHISRSESRQNMCLP